MTEFSEDRVWARHRPRRGAVLIVGTGAVGGFVAEELPRIGISPLWLIDKDNLEVENLIRHPLGAEYLGQPKASSLAAKIQRDFPSCEAVGIDADFLGMPPAEQRRLVDSVDVVAAATDNFQCQRRVNRVCLDAEKPAVFPTVWVMPGQLRDAEISEVLWVLPGRHTPCFECGFAFRQGEADAQAARGARVDLQLLALTTAQVVAAVLDPDDDRSAILDSQDRRGRRQTCIYVHGFTPVSPAVQRNFPTPGFDNMFVRVPFPAEPCPACGQWEFEPPAPAPEPVPAAPRPMTRTPWVTRAHPAPAVSDQQPAPSGVMAVLICLVILAVFINALIYQHLYAKVTHHSAARHVAASPSTAHTRPPVPTVGLRCDPDVGGSYCQPGGNGDLLSLDILGKPSAFDLCKQGYSLHFTDNYGEDLSDLSGSLCLTLSGVDTSWLSTTNSGVPYADFYPPIDQATDKPLCGPWTIILHVKNASGSTVETADYTVRNFCYPT